MLEVFKMIFDEFRFYILMKNLLMFFGGFDILKFTLF